MSENNMGPELSFAAWVGIDWGDKEHAWALEALGSSKRERGSLEQKPEAIAAWAAELATRFDGRPIAVAVEQSRGALIYALSRFQHLVLYPVHPGTAAKFRAALHPSGAKDDPADANDLLEFLRAHQHCLRVLKADSELTRKLQMLVEKRRQMVDARTAETNRMSDLLKLYFPQVLEWFDDLGSAMVGALLERWPTLPQLQAERPEAVRDFLHAHNCRSERRIEQRLQAIASARPALVDAAVTEPAVIVVQALVRVVAALRNGIAALDRAIEETFQAHPDRTIFESLPGAGAVMAPRLLAAFGSRRERFSSASQVASFSGIAPVVSRSGKREWIHFRWACPKFIRQSFHEFAGLSIQQCSWARAFYDQQRKDRKKGHHAALRSLAFKWIRIIFRCWQSHTPYRDELYTARNTAPTALNSSASAASTAPVQFQWITTCGMSKFSGLSS